MATPARVPATTGELLFQDYLDAMQYPYEFEKEFPGKSKRPDYAVTKSGVSLFDVKDFAENLPMKDGGSGDAGSYDPYPPIREKIDEGREKFKEFKEFPCSLVLKNNGNAFVHLESVDIMLGSMYGNSGFTFPVDTKLGRAAGPLKRAFLGRGKMFRYGDAANARNTTISALITLRHVAVGRRRVDKMWEERKSVDRDFGKDDPIAAFDEVCEEAAKRYPNFDVEEKRLGVIVWENAVARIRLSRELFTGPYDEWWGFEENQQRVVFRGEKLAELD